MDITQLPETIGSTIDQIAQRLQVPAEKLLTTAVKGVSIEGVTSILTAFIVSAVTIFALKKVFRWAKEEEEIPPIVLGVAASVIPFVFAMEFLYDGLIMTFAPDYWILKQILGL